MKCRLCDRPTAAGSGKLCFDCTKALHRARGATQRKLASGQAGRVETAAAIDLPLDVVPPGAASSANQRAAWAAIAVAAIVIAWFVQRELAGPGAGAPKIVDRFPSASAQPPASEPAPAIPSIEEPSWTALGNAADDANGQANAAKPQMSAAAAAARASMKKTKSSNQDAKASPALASANEAVAPAEPEPPQHLARANIAPALPADGAQVFAGAMEKCGKESLLAKFICEQKTYLEYCEDKWDKDPRCMRRTATN